MRCMIEIEWVKFQFDFQWCQNFQCGVRIAIYLARVKHWTGQLTSTAGLVGTARLTAIN